MSDYSNHFARLVDEMRGAFMKWGHYRSPHEAYGVLAEEMLELLREIHANDEPRAREEAFQIAAVALRFAVQGSRRDA